MPGAIFHLDLAGLAATDRRLDLLEHRFKDLSPLMATIGALGETDTLDNFQGEHSPAGVPWPKSIRVLEHGGKTLQLSRRLFQSITHRSGPDWAEWGTNVIYAQRHNDGFRGVEQVASHKRTMRHVFGVELADPIEVTVGAFSRQANTPQRQFLGMSAHLAEDIEAAAAEHLDAAR